MYDKLVKETKEMANRLLFPDNFGTNIMPYEDLSPYYDLKIQVGEELKEVSPLPNRPQQLRAYAYLDEEGKYCSTDDKTKILFFGYRIIELHHIIEIFNNMEECQIMACKKRQTIFIVYKETKVSINEVIEIPLKNVLSRHSIALGNLHALLLKLLEK